MTSILTAKVRPHPGPFRVASNKCTRAFYGMRGTPTRLNNSPRTATAVGVPRRRRSLPRGSGTGLWHGALARGPALTPPVVYRRSRPLPDCPYTTGLSPRNPVLPVGVPQKQAAARLFVLQPAGARGALASGQLACRGGYRRSRPLQGCSYLPQSELEAHWPPGRSTAEAGRR